MSSDLARELVLCGALLAGLTVLASHLQPDLPSHTLFAGLTGGGLCVLWATVGRRRRSGRIAAMLTLTTVACLLGWQAVQSWAVSAHGTSNVRIVAILLTVLVAFCVGTGVNLVRGGKSPPP